MEEKTEELRDIFLSVSDDEALVEEQQDDSTVSPPPMEKRLVETVEEMIDSFDINLEHDPKTAADIVKGYFQGQSDSEIAERTDSTVMEVRGDRIRLHLFRDGDPPDELTEAHQNAQERVTETEGEYRRDLRALVDELDLLHGDISSFTLEDGLDGAVEDPEMNHDNAL